MSESQSVGGIHYDVAMDVKPMLSGERQVGSSLDRMEGNFNKASKSIDSAEKTMLSFSKAALAVSSAISVGAVVNMVDQWGQVAARIKMALKSVEGDIEKYASIQERFLEISNRNGKAIEDTQLLYVGAATSMQELGYSTEQTVDYIESLSSSLTANAASANETQSMINALNKAMVSGKVAGENWNSIMNATPTLIGDIAKQLSIMRGGVKVTEQDVKKLAADGKISFQLFADAVIRAKDANNAMADSMDNTVADGFTKLTNSAKAYFGELNQGLGITRSISAGFAVLSENFDKVAAAAVIATSVIGARYVGALSASIKAKIADAAASAKQVLSTRTAALAVREETQAIINNLTAERAKIVAQNQWMASQSVINRQMGINISYQKEYQANAIRISAIDSQMATAKTQLAAATNQASIANRVYAASANALRGGLALIGGPMGAATLAAGAIFYFYQKSQEAKQEALAFADSVDELKNKMKELSDVALMGNVAEANNSIDAQREVIEKLQAELQTLNDNYQWTIKNTADWQNKAESLEKQQRDIAIKTKELEGAQGKLARTIQYVSDVTQELTHRNKDLYDAMNGASGSAGKMGAVLGALQQRIKAAADEKERLNNKMKESPETDDGKKYIQNLKDQNELLNIQDKKKRAIKKAEIEASKITENKGQIDAAKKLAEENYNLSEAEKKRESASKKSTSTGESESKKRANQLLELANANKVAELETKGLYREAAILESVLKLGSTATKAQVAEISDLAGKEFDLKQKIKDREDAYKQNAGLQAARDQKLALEQLDRQLKANLVTEEQYQKRRAEINAEYSKRIAEENAKSVITPTQEMAGQIDPVQQLANENAQKLALIQEYVNQKVLTEEQGLALMNAANKEYEQSRFDAMWGLWKGQNDLNNLMGTAIDSLSSGTATAVSAMLSGTQSAGDAMRNLANTALNAMIQQLMQMAVQALITRTILGTFMGGLGAIPNISSVASSVTSSSSIGGMGMPTDFRSYGGGRYNGGSVNPNNYYRFGERGKPEILQTSSGKNYLLPGEGGKVIPNKGLQGGGASMPFIINVYQQASGATVDVSTEKGLNEQDVINIVVRSIAEGREISGAMATYHNANRKALGGF